jgi:NTE family protein
MATDPNDKTAFVFAGGGSLGAIQVGMLKALVSEGVQADLIVGSSVGAINGAYFAGDPTSAGVDRLEHLWRKIERRDIFPISMLNGFLGVFMRQDHLVRPTSLQRLIERHIRYRRLEDSSVACHVVATDALAGVEVCLSSGPTAEALLASAAIPAVFPPVRMENRYLVDGGVASNTPISRAVKLGAKRLIVLPTGLSCKIQRPPRNVVGMAIHAMLLLVARQLVTDIEHLPNDIELAVVPPLCPLDVAPHDFSHSGKLIELAGETTQRWLAEGGLIRREIPKQLAPHTH